MNFENYQNYGLHKIIEENKKMGFFTRLKKSIFKFEEYEKFVEEPLKRAFGYFFKLMIIFSLLGLMYLNILVWLY